jgi:hypothetical protein
MSAKNRAFGLAIATAALVGFSAPMASAATIAGPSNSGFNGDSVLNVSNNQLPAQICTFGAGTNGAPVAQTITGAIAGVLGAGTGDATATQNNTCANGATQTNSTTTNAGSSSTPTMGGGAGGAGGNNHASAGDPSNSGFNNDSVINLSGNQVPIQACTFGALTNAAGIIQTLAPVVAPLTLATITATTGASGATQTNGCSQSPSQTDTNSVNS